MTTPEQELRRRLEEAVDRFGPWEPPHNIWLGDGIWTITDQQPVENSKLRRTVQVVADLARKPFEQLRVLDLACEGGIFGIELARRGAEVVAVEGRREHVDRARFVKDVLDLSRYEVHQGDVRGVTRETYGEFDVILCLGILYHLDTPDVFDFVHSLSAACGQLLIVDTQISLAPKLARQHDGHEYWGRIYTEHPAGSSLEERERRLRASLDNPESFWLTLPSLSNLLVDAGFTSVLQVRLPRRAEELTDAVVLVANKGVRQEVPRNPSLHDPPARWPEREARRVDQAQTFSGQVRRLVRRARSR